MKKFDLTTIYNEQRPMSWSAISAFKWNKKEWYDKYVLRQWPKTSPEMEFGRLVDEKIQKEPKFLPHLIRYPILQHKMLATFDGVPMVGIADAYRPAGFIAKKELKNMQIVTSEDVERVNPTIRDYKTGRKKWDQARADETGQLTLYTYFLYKIEGIKPADVELYIDWLPTHIKDGMVCFIEEDHRKLKPVTISTKRTMRDLLKFGQHIQDTWKEMEDFVTRYEDNVVETW